MNFLEIFNKIAKIKEDKENLRLVLLEKGASLKEDDLLENYDEAINEISANQIIAYKCSSVDEENKKWSGYKGTFIGNSWVYSETETTGLSFSFYPPAIGATYNLDATTKYTSINNDQRYNDIFYYYDCTSKPSENNLNLIYGTDTERFGIEQDQAGEIPCVAPYVNNGTNDFSQYRIGENQTFNSNSFTVAFWLKNPRSEGDYASLQGVAFTNEDDFHGVTLHVDSDGNAGFNDNTYVDSSENSKIYGSFDNAGCYVYSQIAYDSSLWNHYAFVYNDLTGKATTYINGVPGDSEYFKEWIEGLTAQYNFTLKNSIVHLAPFGDPYNDSGTRMGDIVISKTVMTDEQIKWLAWKSREVTKKQIEFYTPDNVTHELSIEDGDYLEGYLSFDSSFSGDKQIKVNITTEGLPDWIEYFPDTYYLPYSDEGNYYYGTPDTTGTWQVKVVGKIDKNDFNEATKGTYYEGMNPPEVTYYINIVVS